MNRQRLLAVAVVVAGAALALLAAGRDWVTQRVTGVPGVVTLTASGSQAAPSVGALAVVAGAAAVALLLAGRFVARVAGGIAALAGAGVALAVAGVVANPRGAAAPAVPAATGRAGPLTGAAAPSVWVWVAFAGGLVVVAGGLFAAVRGGRWAPPGRRFEAEVESGRARNGPGSGGRATENDAEAVPDAVAAWDALSRGEDPTR